MRMRMLPGSVAVGCTVAGACVSSPLPLVAPTVASSEPVDVADTADASSTDGRFGALALTPPFQHANGIWAGVVIRDLTGDQRPDLLFSNGLNHPVALYANEGDGAFVNIAPSVGLGAVTGIGAVNAGDLDNDGDTDLILSTECSTGSWAEDGNGLADGGHTVWRNDGPAGFTPLPIRVADPDLQAALGNCVVSTGVFDLDLDGALDLVVANGQDPDVATPWIFAKYAQEGRNLILFGDGAGGFEEVQVVDDAITTFSVASWDVDEDGLPDLVFGQGGRPVELWRQTAPREFVVDPTWGDSGFGLWMGLAVADFDRDGELEIYATNQGLSPQKLGYDDFSVRGAGSFVGVLDIDDILAPPRVERHWTNPYHLMLDGTEHEEGPRPLAMSVLAPEVLPTDGVEDAYTDRSGLAGYGWSWGAAAPDLDADGWPDVVFTSNNCSPPMVIVGDEAHGAGPGAWLRNDGAAEWSDRTRWAGLENLHPDGSYADGRGLSVGDLDGDGDADLVYANRAFNTSETAAATLQAGVPLVRENRGPTGNTLVVRVEGTDSNRDGIGTDVWVTTPDGATVRHRVGVGGTTVGTHDLPVLAGLGEATDAEVRVRFPSGRIHEQTLSMGRWVVSESGEVRPW